MKIAQVSPLYESVPPQKYGGTERVVANLSNKLVEMGHEVTLYASGDSDTQADLVPICDKALRLDPDCEDSLAHHIIQLQRVIEDANNYDIIHFHTDYLHYPFSNNLAVPHLTTLHGRLNMKELQAIYNTFDQQPVVSISDHQRLPLPQANWVGTVYHGMPQDQYIFNPDKGQYLAFLGRISPEKRVDRAIKIAIANNKRIKIAAKIDKVDRAYYEREIEPLMQNPLVEFIGEINDEEKCGFLGNAEALLFPIDWPEPFGLVMIEAMACGTPVIAFKNGSVPEVLEHGLTGFIVDNMEEAIMAVGRLDILSRDLIRNEFERRFASEIMVQNYVKIYEMLIEEAGLQGLKNESNPAYNPMLWSR